MRTNCRAGSLSPIVPSPSASSMKNRLSSSPWPDSKSARAQYTLAFVVHCGKASQLMQTTSGLLQHNNWAQFFAENRALRTKLRTHCSEVTSSAACSSRTVALRYNILAASQSWPDRPAQLRVPPLPLHGQASCNVAEPPGTKRCVRVRVPLGPQE